MELAEHSADDLRVPPGFEPNIPPPVENAEPSDPAVTNEQKQGDCLKIVTRITCFLRNSQSASAFETLL